VVKAFGNVELERERFREINEEFYQSRAAIYKHEAWYFTGLSVFFSQLVLAAAVILGGFLLSGAALSITDLISFLLYTAYLTAPIPELARVMQFYQEGLAGFNRFMDIMEIPGEGAEGGPGGPVPGEPVPREPVPRELVPWKNPAGHIEFRDLSFRYGEGEYVLKNISLEIKAGQYLALTGPSGIGKTSLCSLIPRFYPVSSGAILLDGIDHRRIGLGDLRRNIGVVEQGVYLFSGTIRENIAYGKPGAGMAEIEAAAKKANAHGFITALPGGYDTEIGQRGVTLSGGQRQRLCVARVFLKDPAILIFDEATSALDTESEEFIQESLRKLAKNRTTLVIAHRESTIRDADRVLVLGREGIGERERRFT
jgi:ATP-binding cassette subfamily B protein